MCGYLFSLSRYKFQWIFENFFLNMPYIQDIDDQTDYQTFKKKWGHDPRFVALERKEREALLNERYDLGKVFNTCLGSSCLVAIVF